MKFSEWLAEKHPEALDEGLLRNIANSKTSRNLVAGAALAAGAFGLGKTMSSPTKPSVTTNKEEDEVSQDDERFIDDMSSDEGIADEKKKMLNMANQVPMRTTKVGNTNVSRGSAHFSGGKSTPRRLPNLKGGPMSSPDFGGAAE